MYPDKLHLVLAEDDQDDRLFFKNVFDKLRLSHTLDVCEDGIALMNYLNTAEKIPDIIFLDLAMPGKSGIECLKEIKRNPRLREITIAIYTSFNIPTLAEEAFILGANVFIKKPDDHEELRKILSETIYINWQYITDGLDKENFIMHYRS
ncbi:response regulator [Flavobacterium album]|uniref:Response regulator n=1 Tax=Flavobacterium album TaxID=2175091 RepID=A0A2S1R1X3_9FLAO|nr:response regulator [Flavobacterium album]AWH86586.1 response regulator [Flavobacterium album]